MASRRGGRGAAGRRRAVVAHIRACAPSRVCLDRYLVRGVEDVAPNPLFEPREVTFELDRFELADGQLELTGRWFGVKGRRFMRPSLILRGDEGETRLLADLADKPWAAENGEPWRAAFPCDGELDADD